MWSSVNTVVVHHPGEVYKRDWELYREQLLYANYLRVAVVFTNARTPSGIILNKHHARTGVYH
jgi:hypothetical protein